MRITRRSTVGHVQEIVAKMIIKDRIQRVYASTAHEMVALRKFKREHGYCGGGPSCLEYTGDGALCRTCRHNVDHPKSKRPLWEYGKIRRGEREQERAEKAEKISKERVPKRRAA